MLFLLHELGLLERRRLGVFAADGVLPLGSDGTTWLFRQIILVGGVDATAVLLLLHGLLLTAALFDYPLRHLLLELLEVDLCR